MKLKIFPDYESYVKMQKATVDRKLSGPFFTSAEIARECNWMRKHGKYGILQGICHGARAGLESDEFIKHFPKAKVFGTDLFPFSGKSARNPGKSEVIEWDFSKQKEEWIGKFDFVYSNSLDHARDPVQTVQVWMEQLKPNGCLLLQWTRGHTVVCRGDCFGGSFLDYMEILNTYGKVVDLLYVNVPKTKRNRLQFKALESVNFVTVKKEWDWSFFD
jgi:SAM-dependent methyltransferase